MSQAVNSRMRVRGPALVVVFLVLVVLAAAGAWRALKAKPQAGTLSALIAIDGDYAVLVHDVASDPGRSFLRLVSVDRGERWGALIPVYDQEARAAGRVATEAGVVSVRSATGGVPYLHAFEAARGAKLGRHLLTGDEAKAGVVPGVGSLFGDGEVYEFTVIGADITLVAVDIEAGKTRWRRALGSAPIAAAWLRPGRVVVYRAEPDGGGGQLQRIARPDGADIGTDSGTDIGADVAIAGPPCVLDDRAYGTRDGQLVMIALSGGGAADSGAGDGATDAGASDGLTVIAPLGAEAAGDVTLARGGRVCGRFGDTDVLGVAYERQAGDSGDAAVAELVWIDRATSAVRATLTLPASLARAPDAAVSARDDALAARALPRMLPLIVRESAAAGATAQLVMVDLERAAVVWTSASHAALSRARVIATRAGSYLWLPAEPELAALIGAGSGSALARFHGTTGALDAAVAVPGMARPKRAHIVAGALWVYQPASARWAVLDGQTLAPRAAGHGADLVDVGEISEVGDVSQPDETAPGGDDEAAKAAKAANASDRLWVRDVRDPLTRALALPAARR
ncbi:MAG: hypothetical protein Tsb0020_23630 [Haliangiales bacterium]